MTESEKCVNQPCSSHNKSMATVPTGYPHSSKYHPLCLADRNSHGLEELGKFMTEFSLFLRLLLGEISNNQSK